MFKNETVFVLGAGASWHYGYPTGEGLVDDVIAMAGRLSAHCAEREKHNYFKANVPKIVEARRSQGGGLPTYIEAWRQVKRECEALIERLQTVRPLVIDFFLAQNKDLREIGTLMVAAVILAREPTWLRLKGNINRSPSPHEPFSVSRLEPANDDWYRFVVHKLVYGCKTSKDFLENAVQFVTFNYDASLEFHLARALKAIDMLSDADVETFLKERILHVYGCVHDGIPADADMVDEKIAFSLHAPRQDDDHWKPRADFLDRCSLAAANLRTIDPHNKGANDKALMMARTIIKDADVIYILGYGFDENNNDRIGLTQLDVNEIEFTSILFTNYRDMNTINKSVSRLFLGSPRHFTLETIWDKSNEVYIEKSTRNVYDALAMDFDPLETLWAGRV
jgi:hypothetical protein